MTPASRFTVFLTVVLGIWTLQHVYAGWRLLSLPLLRQPPSRSWAVVVLVVGLLSYPAARFAERLGPAWLAQPLELVGSLWMGCLFLIVVWLAAADLLTLGGLVLRPWVATVRTAAVGVALASSIAAALWALAPPRTVEVEAVVDGLPARLDGLRVVAVSDVHLGASVGTRRLRVIVDRVLALEPDMIAVVGDLVDGGAHLVDPTLPELRRLQAPLGAFAVLGNHEFYVGAERSRELMRSAGLEVLDNRHVEVAEGLVVAGVPDPRGSHQTGSDGADLELALRDVDPGAAVVLLQHSPQDEAAAAAQGVDLMLCGHTHGGQIWPFHYLVRRAYPHLAGVFTVGSMTQVVSRGAGFWGPPMRLFAPADIVRVTLRAAPPARRAGSSVEP